MSKDVPYYAVIFTSTLTENDSGYTEMAERMENLAKKQPGFLGFESARSEVGITVSYWKTLKSIADWKAQTDHQFAQEKGIQDWYKWYKVRICTVERAYDFSREASLL
ncbi:antibiotic biosynthesis monooxygenase family protein [Ulvibacterium marinum]|uniref:antibiotic biosynthesis monooxygenase family protein n=1 Tax=Ulvibacterium marinum TaxID=2419782 RepID=UPI0024954465|nr:antibiotic biosynthesis monooxygenase [Ulvibacterium marinum]